ncbi:MAG TPA: TolC family protein [Steroidobacteraceae bacterium]|jgi:outer membrane protein TolC|nr:TolC family protein [Steroidobacteraceae bacterium]
MTSNARRVVLSLLPVAVLSACAGAPARAPLEPAATLAEYDARKLEGLGELPPASSGWDRAQWLAASLQLNPQLAQERAEVRAAAAAERTAAERPNPTMQLFAEYLTSAAQSGAWLYGLSLDFLLRPPGERARARQHAALETALAQSDLAESLWQVRATLRGALLDAVSAQDESALLQALVAERQALLDTDRARLRLGDIARTQVLSDELELSRAQQRLQQARARGSDAAARLAAAVGVPVAALEGVPLRWVDWEEIGGLYVATPERWRTDALIARPQIVHALREYDLAELGLQSEVAKRWPQVHLTPAYAWGGNGVRENTLFGIGTEAGAAVAFEVPLFNQHQGAIGQALARRAAAGEHLKAVQAEIFGQIDRAELAWPAARQAWADTRQAAEIAERQRQAEQRALAAGSTERASVVAAQIAATEAQLLVLQAAYTAESVFGTLEDAYRRPLQGNEGERPPGESPRS